MRWGYEGGERGVGVRGVRGVCDHCVHHCDACNLPLTFCRLRRNHRVVNVFTDHPVQPRFVCCTLARNFHSAYCIQRQGACQDSCQGI